MLLPENVFLKWLIGANTIFLWTVIGWIASLRIHRKIRLAMIGTSYVLALWGYTSAIWTLVQDFQIWKSIAIVTVFLVSVLILWITYLSFVIPVLREGTESKVIRFTSLDEAIDAAVRECGLERLKTTEVIQPNTSVERYELIHLTGGKWIETLQSGDEEGELWKCNSNDRQIVAFLNEHIGEKGIVEHLESPQHVSQK